MRKLKYLISVAAITAMIITGCSNGGTGNTDGTAVAVTEEAKDADGGVSTVLAGLNTTSEIAVDTEFTARDLEVGYEESTAVNITLKDNGTEISGAGAAADGNTVTISKEGTYVLTGTLSEGQIVVEVQDSEKVQLVLDGVTLHNSTSAPVYIKSADKVFITLEEGSVNTLTDGSEYVQTDDNTVDGVIFSKVDLTLNGSGTLNITASYKHGIVSKDDIVITGGNYNITAVKDAINGKDAIKIKDGDLTLSADTGNGIQSKNADDTTKGYVYIAGGNITVTKSQEGIEGTAIVIEDGVVDITAADDGMNAASGSSDTEETTENALGQEGGNGMTPPDNGFPGGTGESTGDGTDDNTAAKGFPADGFPGGSAPDTAQSDGTGNAVPSGTASDAGTAGGGTSGTESGGRGGMQRNPGNFGGGGMDAVDANCYILISGGRISIDAAGDGIDSNGNLYVTGGTLYVYGPTNSGNGALDYNGTADITGGYVYTAGSSGMAQGFSDTSTQYSILYNLTNVSTAGTEITLTDASGNTIASFTPEKEYQSIVISTPDLAKDAAYTLTSGDQTGEITLSSVVTSNGQQGMGGQGGFQNRR